MGSIVVLRPWWAPWLLSSLWVVEGGIWHVGIAGLRLRCLRRVWLGRSEIRAAADMAGAGVLVQSRIWSRQVVRRLRRGSTVLEAVRYRRRSGGCDVTDVLEGLRVLHVVRHHAMLLGRGVGVAWRRAIFVLVLVLVILLAHKVLRAFVLVCAAILRDLSARLH